MLSHFKAMGIAFRNMGCETPQRAAHFQLKKKHGCVSQIARRNHLIKSDVVDTHECQRNFREVSPTIEIHAVRLHFMLPVQR